MRGGLSAASVKLSVCCPVGLTVAAVKRGVLSAAAVKLGGPLQASESESLVAAENIR